MNNEIIYRRRIHVLEMLNATLITDNHRKYLEIHVKGYSKKERIGYPLLIIKSIVSEGENKILEFEFVIDCRIHSEKEQLFWETKIIYDYDELPPGITAVKVIAEKNADIVII